MDISDEKTEAKIVGPNCNCVRNIKKLEGYLELNTGEFTDKPEITEDCARLKRF
jgi:hypothetical protein